jgi:site-specific recombinase XerD
MERLEKRQSLPARSPMNIRIALQRLREDLQRCNYSTNTLDSSLLDLQMCFADSERSLAKITFRDVELFIDTPHHTGLVPPTISRRLHARQHFFDYLFDPQVIRANPVQPRQFLRRGQSLPNGLPKEQIETLFAPIHSPMDKALSLLMLRCGLRVSEVAHLNGCDIDWSQHALRIAPG